MFIVGLAIGAAVGAGITLLTTPRSGRALRDDLMAKLGGWQEPERSMDQVTVAPYAPSKPILSSGEIRPDLVGTTERGSETVERGSETMIPARPRANVTESAPTADGQTASSMSDDDRALAEEVEQRIRNDAETTGSVIGATASGSTITLSGRAPTSVARERAAVVAQTTPGVTVVHDNVEVDTLLRTSAS